MAKKQIAVLCMVAAATLLIALLWQPQSAASPIEDMSIYSPASSSAETADRVEQAHGESDFPVSGRSDSHDLSQPNAQGETILANLHPARPDARLNDTVGQVPGRSGGKLASNETQPVVHLQVSEPDGTLFFDVRLNPGDDLCDNLVEALREGKIRSLAIDDSYLATFGSRYIREINGYSNNWTVEVNGVGPKGCSLSYPEAGDKIIWTFGT